MPIYMNEAFSLNFTKVGGGIHLKLAQPQVQGFISGEAPTAADAHAVADAIDALYEGLSPAQQGIVHQLLLQASEVKD